MIDALLYEWFPNRLPGEIDDSLDLLRFWRMVQAKSVMSSEDERSDYLDGGSNALDKGASESAKRRRRANLMQWAEHDRLIAEFGLDDA